MRKNSPERLGSEPVHKLLLSMGVQTTMSLMLFSVYSLTDTFFIARGISAFAAGGVSLTLPIMMVLGAVSTTLGAGGASIVSRALGKGDKERAAHTTANSFMIFWAAAILFTLVGMIFLDPIMKLMGADETLMPYAKGYARIIFLGAVTSTGFSSIIRAEGNTKFSMYIWVFPVLINLVFDPLFIFAFKWGVEGAAAATVLGQAVSAGMSIYYFFFSKRDAYKVELRHFKPKLKLVGEIISIGSPSLISQVGMSFMTVTINQILLQSGGAVAITAFGIVSRIQSFLVIPQNGIVQGMQPIVGFNLAAGALERVKKAFWMAVVGSGVYGLLTMAVGVIFARPLVGVFIKEADIGVLAVAALGIVALSFPVKGVPTIVAALFQAEGKPFLSVAVSVGRLLAVQLPAILLMNRLYSLNGIWFSFVVADAVTCVAALLIAQNSLKRSEKEGILHV